MYQSIVNKISSNSQIKIKDIVYNVNTKTHYSNVLNPDLKYTKFNLTKNKILVINPQRQTAFLGEIVEDFFQGEQFPNDVVYKGLHYKIYEKDYQIVNSIEFGNPLDCEGECFWADYVCQEDENLCIDMAFVYRDKKRADIFAQLIKAEDIEVI